MNEIITAIGKTAFVSSLLALGLGGIVSYFKLFITSTDDFDKKIKLSEELLKAKLTRIHTDIIEKSLVGTLYTVNEIPKYQSIIEHFTNESLRTLKCMLSIQKMAKTIDRTTAYLVNTLYFAAFSSLVCIISSTIKNVRYVNETLAFMNIIIIIIQLFLIKYNININRKFRHFEQTI